MDNIKQQSRSKKMAKDFLVYSIGVIGSKLMTFLLLPLYTHYIKDPAEYGYYDYCLTACLLLLPIVTLQLRDGAFRFLLDTQDTTERSRIVTLINKLLLQTTFITILVALALYFIYPIKHLGYTTILLIVMSFYEVYTQTVRGLGNNRSFIIMGLSASLGIGVLSVLFLVILHMGVEGIFLANIIARIIAVVAVDWHNKVLKQYFKPSLKGYKELQRNILKFSLPLLPAAICWWFVSYSNRYFIKEYLSMYDSGIYGVASRLAIVVQSIAIIFYQTWQENAIQQYHSKDKNHFFTKVFNIYIIAFVTVTLFYTFGANLVFPYVFNETYIKSLDYLYQLSIATVLFALSSYFEVIYHCEKKTNRLLPPVIMGPIINVILNLILIKPLGVNGVIISYAVTYLFIIVYRWFDVKKYIQIKFYPTTFIPVGLLVVGAIPFIFKTSAIIDILLMIACTGGLFTSPLFRENIAKKFASKLKR